jgi:hypothetical protein
MKNIKEIKVGNDSVGLEFTSRTAKSTMSFDNQGFNIPSNISIGDRNAGNYSQFNEDGTLIANGEASCWDDLRFPVTQTKQGANLKPDFNTADLGLEFPSGNTAERIYIIAQMPHEYVLATAIRPHIHYVQTSSTVPTFKMMYRWYNNGELVPSTFTTISTVENVFEYPGTGSLLQILRFPEIPGAGVKISSVLDIVIYRDDTVVLGDVLVKEFDIHYQIDMLGSRHEFIKY